MPVCVQRAAVEQAKVSQVQADLAQLEQLQTRGMCPIVSHCLSVSLPLCLTASHSHCLSLSLPLPLTRLHCLSVFRSRASTTSASYCLSLSLLLTHTALAFHCLSLALPLTGSHRSLAHRLTLPASHHLTASHWLTHLCAFLRIV